jgi:hypothetical protein
MPTGHPADYAPEMSAEREELLRLVQALPDNQVPQVLTVLCRHLRSTERPWPPAFFASAPGSGERIADHVDDLLHEGFGH